MFFWKRKAAKQEGAAERIAAIEKELRSIGYWSESPLKPEQYNFTAAFALDTMAFAQWLQFVFVPRVQQVIAEKGEFPKKSMVAAQAVREFDGDTKADGLIGLLAEFDEFIAS